VEDGDHNEVMPNVAGGEATILQGNLQELIRNKKEASINLEEDEDEDEDEARMIHCCNIVVMVAMTTMMSCPQMTKTMIVEFILWR
jgi:hypothetical protein